MNPTPPDYQQLLTEVKQRVRAAQYRALQQVSQQQMQLYWGPGASSLPSASRPHGWGKSVVETLARDLQTEFVGSFLILAPVVQEFLQPAVGEIYHRLNYATSGCITCKSCRCTSSPASALLFTRASSAR